MRTTMQNSIFLKVEELAGYHVLNARCDEVAPRSGRSLAQILTETRPNELIAELSQSPA